MLSINSIPVTRQAQPAIKFGAITTIEQYLIENNLDGIKEEPRHNKAEDAAILISDALERARNDKSTESLNDIKNDLGYELQKYSGADVADVGKRLKAMAQSLRQAGNSTTPIIWRWKIAL